MPFRETYIPMHTRAWLLPTFGGLSILGIIVWSLLAFNTVGGYTKANTAQKLIVFGWAGLAAIMVFGFIVTVAIIEAALYESRMITLTKITELHEVESTSQTPHSHYTFETEG